MSTYVISDIHGEYDKFMDLLGQIDLKDSDTLYILGDVLDRGPHPIKTLHKLMEMPNAYCIAGNHEFMALDCLQFLARENTEESRNALDEKVMGNLLTWEQNGAETTIKEFLELSLEERNLVIEFLGEFSAYEEVFAGGKEYLLVHAGLENYTPGKDIEEYSIHELIWSRPEYDIQYFEDVYVVSGHTPTQLIENNPKPGYIFRKNNHIAIDCGACFPGGRLAALCLDTEEEYYYP